MAITRAQQFKQMLAQGGRIGLQEGGGIEQRLEQLGGDVTSAEQVLQAINKRLETAESSLGSGGGGLGSIAQPFIGGIAQPLPITIEILSQWTKGLKTKQIALAPITAIVDKQSQR